MILIGVFYNQLIIYDPVRRMEGAGILGADLAGSSFGVSHIGLITPQVGTAFSAGGTFVDTSYCRTARAAADASLCPPRISSRSWVFDIIITVLIIQVGSQQIQPLSRVL